MANPRPRFCVGRRIPQGGHRHAWSGHGASRKANSVAGEADNNSKAEDLHNAAAPTKRPLKVASVIAVSGLKNALRADGGLKIIIPVNADNRELPLVISTNTDSFHQKPRFRPGFIYLEPAFVQKIISKSRVSGECTRCESRQNGLDGGFGRIRDPQKIFACCGRVTRAKNICTGVLEKATFKWTFENSPCLLV